MLSDRDYMNPQAGRHGQHISMVTLLIWANVIIFALQFLTENRLSAMLWLDASSIAHLEVWRLGTYMFVHGDPLHGGVMHIVFNMWMLHVLGRLLEQRIGGTRFLNLYLISGLLGGLVWLFFNWNSPDPVVGASGAIFGVMMATGMLFPNERFMLLLPPVEMPLKSLVALCAGIEIISEFFQVTGTFNDRIAHLAHLGGILGGFLYMRRLMPAFHFRFADRWRALFRFRHSSPRREDKREPEDPRSPADFQRDVDRILDKIGREGLSSLTQEERKTMDRARKRLRDR